MTTNNANSTKKLSREEKRELERAEARARRIAEFRTKWLRDTGRKVFDRNADMFGFTPSTPAAETDRSVWFMLYHMVEDMERLRRDIRHRIESCQETFVDALKRLDAGADPSWYSDGILGGSGRELDQLVGQLKSTKHYLAMFASANGYRVREIEDDRTRAKSDEYSRIVVLATSANGWGVCQMTNGEPTWLSEKGFTPCGVTYGSVDDAYAALHVFVHGSTI